jgi:hypothetical protein
MRYVTVLGAGLLVGTALAVIVPEGVHALYMSEIETNQMQTQHEYHADHKIVARQLNQIDHGVKEPIAREVKIDHDGKDEALPPVHQHIADRPRELGSEPGHKNADTTHSAIGRNKLSEKIQEII